MMKDGPLFGRGRKTASERDHSHFFAKTLNAPYKFFVDDAWYVVRHSIT